MLSPRNTEPMVRFWVFRAATFESIQNSLTRVKWPKFPNLEKILFFPNKWKPWFSFPLNYFFVLSLVLSFSKTINFTQLEKLISNEKRGVIRFPGLQELERFLDPVEIHKHLLGTSVDFPFPVLICFENSFSFVFEVYFHHNWFLLHCIKFINTSIFTGFSIYFFSLSTYSKFW